MCFSFNYTLCLSNSLLGPLITFVNNFDFNLVIMFVYFVNQSSVLSWIYLKKTDKKSRYKHHSLSYSQYQRRRKRLKKFTPGRSSPSGPLSKRSTPQSADQVRLWLRKLIKFLNKIKRFVDLTSTLVLIADISFKSFAVKVFGSEFMELRMNFCGCPVLEPYHNT